MRRLGEPLNFTEKLEWPKPVVYGKFPNYPQWEQGRWIEFSHPSFTAPIVVGNEPIRLTMPEPLSTNYCGPHVGYVSCHNSVALGVVNNYASKWQRRRTWAEELLDSYINGVDTRPPVCDK